MFLVSRIFPILVSYLLHQGSIVVLQTSAQLCCKLQYICVVHLTHRICYRTRWNPADLCSHCVRPRISLSNCSSY
jgi:hypothetical protein